MKTIELSLDPCAVREPKVCRSPSTPAVSVCFRCGRPVCSACSLRMDGPPFGTGRYCHDCAAGLGRIDFVIRNLSRQGVILTPGEAAARTLAAPPPMRPALAEALVARADRPYGAKPQRCARKKRLPPVEPRLAPVEPRHISTRRPVKAKRAAPITRERN